MTGKTVFVTVGSTRFDALVDAVLRRETIAALKRKGYSNMVVQCGNSPVDNLTGSGPVWQDERDGLRLDIWRFKPSIADEVYRADLVISHAGSGTILDVLRTPKPLVVVPNETLLDNHQIELALALSQQGYLTTATTSTLPETIESLQADRLVPFPSTDGSRFQAILDEEMGFI
ncbi:glycosyltransferase family 1 protein [Botryobasidium botryosum FD-172 SS1]|uniref:UDP-N-acetylglucosamine transferase subunit ALG13 n=1 Tax=Botryobasidium botryosum (strain FD-172 SS1) TaxID=930990 RepID=A0A067M7U7_BOTB1|nr:glycosyltransferase family 1 protein [Botryobasidium botryosum FD-172 SS1]